MKFKKFYYIIILFIICLFGFITSSYSKIDNLNEIIDVGNILYVQHDENNQDIYLLNSNSLPVYEVLNVKYTASKQWTQDGLYIDDPTGKVSATSPDDYIPVRENEIYFVRLYGIGSIYTGESGNEWHITTPIVFFDDNNNCVGSALTSTFSASKNGVEITIPNSATKMYISNYNNQNISIQKKLTLDENEFNIIKDKQKEILNYIDSSYENIHNDPVIYNDYDKAYITFVNDDTRPAIDQFADLFINKNVPLCLATIASNSLNTASNLRETRLEVLKRVEENGGEILAHYENPITNENIDDKNYLYNYFVVQKQLLTSYGLNVNGIILAGGNGQITGNIKTSSWASSIYKYSDLLGEKNNNFTSTYFKPRKALSNFNNDLDKIKKSIDEAIDNNEWHIYYFHDVNEISLENLEALIDYIQSKENVEIVTYKTMYDKFATRESNVKNNKKTYYVASNGKSNDGTSIDKAINLDTLNKKKIKSGDTILFKRGDNFIGSVALNINSYDNKKITISSYGNGDLPTISLYKYLNKAWEKFDENIYRINIKELDDIKSYNVAYLEDDNKIKYYNKKNTLGSLSNNYDFYSDNLEYLYMYLNEDPYRSLGNLKCVVKGNLFNLYSNMHISNLRFSYSGGHALVSPESRIENVEIDNCIIENIGGSYLYSNSLSDDTRYGNGIEFYNTDVKDVKIKNNIFRNIYDVAFTIQGVKGSGTNIFVDNNVFINNSQDSEIWESENAQGVVNYVFANNLSINQGKGWSYLARSDKYASASILFWGYDRTNTDISFIHNVLYNPRQIYYFALTTDNYFLHHDTIKSD